MFILDRYALRLFLKVLVVSFLSLTGLYVMVVSIENLDEFITLGRRQGSFVKVFADFYTPRVLTFFDGTYPFLSLLSAMFVIAWMQSTNELISIQAGGIPKGRIVRPLIVACVFVSLLGVVNRELVIPRMRPQLVRDVKDTLGTSTRAITPRYDHETDIFLSGGKSIVAEAAVLRPVFRLPRQLHGFARQIEAEKARFLPANDLHPDGYLMETVTRPSGINALDDVEVDERVIIHTPRHSDWLEPGQCFVASRVSFDQLLAGSTWQRFASSRELLAGLRSAGLNYGAEARVTVHARFLQPILDLTLVFLGLPLVISRHQRGLFVAIGHTTLVVSVFVTVVMASRALGSNYLLSPSMAAWLPLIVFVPLATALAPRFWD